MTQQALAATGAKQSRLLMVLAFLAIYLVWGTTYLAITYGLKGFPPFLLSGLRYCIAGLLLLPVGLASGSGWPRRKEVFVCLVSGVLALSGGTGLVTWGEQYVSSGQAAIIMATEPFWFVAADRANWANYFANRLVPAGLLIGFAGIVLFFCMGSTGSSAQHGHMQWIGYAVVLASAVLWVLGSMYAKKHLTYNGYSNIMSTSLQLLFAGVFSGLVGLPAHEWSHFNPGSIPGSAWGGLFYLVVMGSLVAYLSFSWLITVLPPAIVSTHTYVNPLVAVAAGWWLGNEYLGGWQLLALGVILTGLLLTNIPAYQKLKRIK